MNKKLIEDIYPLSPMQEGILFHTCYAQNTGTYCISAACILEGDLNVDAFRKAWQSIVDRHSILRTGFFWENREKPLQIVFRKADLPFRQQDWRGVSASVQQIQMEQYLRADREQNFDLRKPPLLRLALIRLNERAYYVVWSHHHLVLDGWCQSLLLKEVFTRYEAYRQGQECVLEKVRPYGDYIAWLQQQDLSKAETFWREKLQGFRIPVLLAGDRNGETPHREMGQEFGILPEELLNKLNGLSRRRRLTLNTLMQGAWAVLLSRYSDRQDVVFGTIVSGRPPQLAGMEEMIGLFINNLPVRVWLDLEKPVCEWLNELQDQRVTMSEHEYSPLVEVQRWSEVPRGTPLFDNILVFDNYPVDEALPRLAKSLRTHGLRMLENNNYPLSVDVGIGKRLLIKITYDLSRFDSVSISRILLHLERVLETIVEDPDRRLGELDVLNHREREQLLVGWNETEVKYSEVGGIHHLIEEQVDRNPDAIAAVFEGKQVNYRELNRLTNRLACYLRKLGVGPEVLVGICVDRSLEMIVGILGIMKAGGVYVPIDSTFPLERIDFILQDAGAAVLLTQEHLEERLPVQKGIVVYMDRELEVEEDSEENVNSGITGKNLAYVIYTSGSTGRPKGVAVEHRQVVNYTRGIIERMGFGSEEHFATVSTIAADLGNTVIFPSLCSGGCLHIISEERLTDGVKLAEYFESRRIDHLKIVPSHLKSLLRTRHRNGIMPRKSLILGGEASECEWVRMLAELSPDCRIFNHYGPTETTVGVLACRPGEMELSAPLGIMPLGRPLSNSQVYLLSSRMEPVAVGMRGEIHIGGEGVARGYLGRPDWTAERFIPDPFGRPGAGRLYRTGDWGRYLVDGQIEFLGRTDDQVKLRGYRVELGEIESVLREERKVAEVTVVVREDEPGEKHLVAYIVAKNESTVSAGELRRYLRERLPGYMVPSYFVLLEKLPLTTNGKVNRQALPVPKTENRKEEELPELQTAIEEVLAMIWTQVLKLERVGLRENFFELGGHSLLAMQVVSRIREVFKVELPLHELFDHPTVKALGVRVDLLRCADPEPMIPVLVPVRRDQLLLPSYAQERLWFLHQLMPESTAYNVARVGRTTGQLNVGGLEWAINEVIRRHEVLRTTFEASGGKPVQVIREYKWSILLVVDLAELPDAAKSNEAEWLIKKEEAKPFDLSQGPVMRMSLLRLGAEEHVILYTLHHIASDGWSLGVLNREVGLLYKAFCQGQPSPLPELAIQYADFAVWQRGWLQGEVLETQIKYWREQLAGIGPLQLPTDRLRSVVQDFSGAMKSINIRPDLASGLKELSRREGVTLFMTVLAGLQVLLSRYSGQESVVIGSVIANRNWKEIEGLIGFFVNTLALRTDLSGDPTVKELLGRVREVTLGAYGHQDLPFERLVEEFQPERDMSRNPLVQVVLELLNAPNDGMDLEGVTLQPAGGGEITSRFDMEVHIREHSQGLIGWIEYNRNLFEPSTMERMVGHLERVLEGLVNNIEGRISELPMLGGAELEQLLVEWNDTQAEYSRVKCIHEMFEAQVELCPSAMAVLFGEQQVSYQELNARANQLAHYLKSLGVISEDRVGICVERNPVMVAGLLGILKAGGAYVPLDPAYPKERLAFMLEDAQVKVLVTQVGLYRLFDGYSGSVVFLDGDDRLVRNQPTENPAAGIQTGNLAYLIYTSGSTGKPKGVAIAHQSAIILLQWAKEIFGAEELAGVLASTSICFDLSVFELFFPLCHGGRIILIENVLHLGGCTHAREVALVNTVPSAMAELLRMNAIPASVRTVNLAGEALTNRLVEQIYAQTEVLQVFDLYGPSEDTTYSTFALRKPGGPATIGRPIANTRVYILDGHGQPVPIGIPGELCISGDGLARGYYNRPELTAKYFIPDIHGKESGGRLYQTGDLARYLPNGQIEYLGRIDQQVKIRGYRIELGEVENVIRSHRLVKEGAVMVREDVPGDRRLVGYVVGDARQEQNGEQAEQVAEWQSVFDDHVYKKYEDPADPAFNIVGWKSSYNGEAIPAEEMREWLADTVERIRGMNPKRVLEIGCGTGMILFGVAPQCEEYWGTDFSQQALAYIERQMGRAGLEKHRVKLLQRRADDLAGISDAKFNAVILNSVVQYFPDVEYLLKVIEEALSVVADGGFIFLGDIRSLPLAEAFAVTVQLAKIGENVTVKQLRQRVQQQQMLENELLIAPEFFYALKQRLGRIGKVEVMPKRGLGHNELMLFRYQVILHVGTEERITGAEESFEWKEHNLNLATVRHELETRRPGSLKIENVANARLNTALAAVKLVRASDPADLASGLKGQISQEGSVGEQPGAWERLGKELGYEVELSWGGHGEAGKYEVLLWKGTRRHFEREPMPVKPWREYANNPMYGKLARRLIPELKSYVAQQLPKYMVPSMMVVLEKLPLTVNGKVDWRALPAPEVERTPGGGFVEPRNEVEWKLAEIWSKALGVERVGIDDDFFELGGHSLLATQVVSRVREVFEVELPLRNLFEASTVAGLSRKLEEARRSVSRKAIRPLLKAGKREKLPLSFAQERLWFIDQLQSGSTGYNIPGVVRLIGALRVEVLVRVVNEILRRHEVLRTTFKMSVDGPEQVIHEHRWTQLPLIDLVGLKEQIGAAEAKRLIQDEVAQSFNLNRGPVVRTTLLQLGLEDHVILYTMHHIASDGWSIGVLNREISLLYEAFSKGEASPLQDLPIQYADFAIWQREYLQGEVLDSQLRYWKEQLTGITPLQLATDRPRPMMQTVNGARQGINVSREVADGLKILSRKEGVTLFMILLAGFEVLLSRYSGQEDIAIGSVIANRNRKEIEGVIGFFVNMLVLRANLSKDPTVTELLRQVREVTLGAYGHQDLPFERLVEELQPERDMSRNPLVQVTLQLLNMPDEGVKLKRMASRPVEGGKISTRFDLEVHFREHEQGLTGWMIYNTDLFEEKTMERMAAHLERVLGAFVKSPMRRVSQLAMLDEAERNRLLDEWNRTAIEYPQNGCIQELFEEQVEQSPEAIAVVCEEQSLTYRQVNTYANQLAHHLRKLGVKAEVIVGICLERSLEMLIGILGILKAGGAYVPLDPSYPRERLRFMLEDSQVTVLLTLKHLAEQLSDHGTSVVCLDNDWKQIATEGKENLHSSVNSKNLAYMIYTSGSTGMPKGVLITHGSLMNSTLARITYYGEPVVRFLLLSSFAFDSSVAGIFWTVCQGGALVLPGAGKEKDPRQIIDIIARNKVSHLLCLPLLYEMCLGEENSSRLTSLRAAIVAGESCPPGLPVLHHERLPQVDLFNEYGPTEGTVWSTVHKTDWKSKAQQMPIGRPVSNVLIYILDKHLQPVPLGIQGELYIGGTGLARGYWRRAELTAEKFIPNSFGAEPGSRLYRTGDLARYLGNGDIEYSGRADEQVKIRGYRIELGEVESVMRQHPDVKECVVMVREDLAGDKRLVGYVIGQGWDQETSEQAEQVAEWHNVFDAHLYKRYEDPVDPTFNVVGWTSSYTGEAIPAEEMREWLADTVERILEMKPRRVLELGCGTGLVLFRVAPQCEEFWGTDFSSMALDYIERQIGRTGLERKRVKLLQCQANNLEEISGEKFSGVVLNSVVQYFPDVEYLMKVLEGALAAVADGGFIFLGDIRSLPLAEAFAATVQLAKASGTVGVKELQQRVRQQRLQEKELWIEPEFFFALKQKLRRIGKVEIMPKRGSGRNELMLFRYQVILHVGVEKKFAETEEWLTWQEGALSLEAIRQRLMNTKTESLGIRNIPNRRLGEALETVKLIQESEPEKTVAQLKSKLGGARLKGEEPGAWDELGKEFGYGVDVSWARHGAEGRYDVIFWKGERREFGSEPAKVKAWREYTNNPLHAKMARQLARQLRSYVGEKMPTYMVPSAIVVLEKFPLTGNGKIDRRALPVPEPVRRRTEDDFVGPRNGIEQKLADIWSKVLGLEQVGVNDNFFELGGHSLLATQVVSRTREAFEVELPVSSLFQTPTIAELSSIIMHADHGEVRGVEKIRKVDRKDASPSPEEVGNLSEKEVDLLLANLLEESD